MTCIGLFFILGTEPLGVHHTRLRLKIAVGPSGRRVGGVWTRVRVVTWFRRGTNPWGDPRGALAPQLVGQVRDQRLTAYPLLLLKLLSAMLNLLAAESIVSAAALYVASPAALLRLGILLHRGRQALSRKLDSRLPNWQAAANVPVVTLLAFAPASGALLALQAVSHQGTEMLALGLSLKLKNGWCLSSWVATWAQALLQAYA